MATRYHWMADTSSEAFEKMIELMRAMPPDRKLAMALGMSEMLMRLSEAGVRQLYPNASEREVFLRAAARRLGRDTVIRVYGWDPEGDTPP